MSFLSRVMVLKSKAHFSASTTGVYTDHAAFEGARKKRAARRKAASAF
ncbi:division-specific transpeptidase, penicillin-binding protein [Agrobacterium tumefaciens]|nr:division-specific transpeptidase, penicillin-binding protein [Agrobacterium tumefaciens]